MAYYKAAKKKHLLIVITHVHTLVHLHAVPPVPLHVVVIVQILVREHVQATHHALVETVVLGLANLDAVMLALILVKLDVRELAMQNAEMIVGVLAQQVVIMDALVAIGINNEFNYKENRILAVRLSKKHHLHRHEGLPIGL